MKLLPLHAAALLLCAAGVANAAGTATEPAIRNMSDMKFAPLPGFPTCATASIQQGNPASEPILVLVKLERKCAIPWHWHTPNEYVMLVKGEGYLEMKDNNKAQTLKPGGFGAMPSKHVHQFQCTSKSCMVYVHADSGPFDIHYVDAQGKEIPPADALKIVKESTVQ